MIGIIYFKINYCLGKRNNNSFNPLSMTINEVNKQVFKSI